MGPIREHKQLKNKISVAWSVIDNQPTFPITSEMAPGPIWREIATGRI